MHSKAKSRGIFQRVLIITLFVYIFGSLIIPQGNLNFKEGDNQDKSSEIIPTYSLEMDDDLNSPELIQKTTQALENPFINEITPLIKLPEILVFGTDTDGGDLNGYIWDDSYHNFSQIKNWNDNDNSESPSIAWGDFDRDGKDEYVLASTDTDGGDLNMWIRDDSSTNFENIVTSNENDNLCNPSVSSADFDGDGQDEIALVASTSNTVKLYIWKEPTGIPGAIWTMDVTYSFTTEMGEDPDVCTGDIDGDDLEEIICLARDGDHLVGWVWDWNNANFELIKSWDLSINIQEPHVACGDVDGDNIDEIVFLGVEDDGGDLEGRIIDDALHGFTIIHVWDANDNSANPDVICGDFDHDFIEEIVFYATDTNGGDMNMWIWDDYINDCTEMFHSDEDDNYGKGSIAAGDIYLEGKDNLIIATESGSEIKVLIYDYNGISFEIRDSFLTWNTGESPSIALGDTHGDGIQITQLDQEIIYRESDPQIMTVISAPPTISNITQNYLMSETVVGSEDFSQETNSETLSLSSAVTLSYSKSLFSAVEFKVAQTISSELTKSQSVTYEFARCSYYHVSGSSDGIIFSITNFADFNYTITSHPDGTSTGEIITVSVPISYEVYKWQLSSFNSAYPTYNVNEIFNHTIGHANTYNSKADLASQSSGILWYSDKMNVGQGEGVTKAIIEVSSMESTTMENSMQYSTSLSSEFFGFGVELSQSTKKSSAYEITIGTGFHYEGVVGDIASMDEWNTLNYGYGICVYSYIHPTANYTCQVVNYWIEGANENPENSNLWYTITEKLESWLPFDWYYTMGGAGVIILGISILTIAKIKKK